MSRKLDGLMGGTVLAQRNRIVGVDEDRLDTHERGEPYGVTGVIGEHQECPAIGEEPAVQGEAVHDGRHGELAHAIINVVAVGRGAGERPRSGPVGAVRFRQIRRASQELRQEGGVGVQAAARCLARSHPRVLAAGLAGGPLGRDPRILAAGAFDERLHLGVPLRRQLAMAASLEFCRELGMRTPIAPEALVPLVFVLLPAPGSIPGGIDLLRDDELRVGPAEQHTRLDDLLSPERGAVRLLGAALGGCGPADHGPADEQARAVGDGPCRIDGHRDRGRVVDVDGRHDVPAIGREAPGDIVGEPTLDPAVDGDAVGIVDRDGALGDGHADGVGKALAQGARGILDARRLAVFGVARGLGMQSPKGLEIVDGEGVAGEVQQRVQEHRAVAVRHNEAVSVRPPGVRRVVAQVVVPEDLGDIGHAHGRARVPGLGPLHRVHAEEADGIRQLAPGGTVGLLSLRGAHGADRSCPAARP